MLNFLTLLGKLKLTPILIVLALTSTGLIIHQRNQISKLKKENERVSNNFFNANQEIKTVRNKNGELSSTVNQLNLTVSELKQYSEQTASELNNMRVKLKNVSNITHFQTRIVYKVDTVFEGDSNHLKTDSTPVITGVTGSKAFRIKNEWIDNSFQIRTDSNRDPQAPGQGQMYLSNYSLAVRDSIITVTETQYKRFWIFWKRPVGVKLHIKSFNPYSNFEKIESIQLH